MIEAMLLTAALVWIAIAIGTGMLVCRWQQKRWTQIATTLFLIWLPFWDVIPGYYLYRKAIREVGGVRIYKTVQAEGYLDLAESDCVSCWARLKDSTYRYLEVFVAFNALDPARSLTPVPGHYEFKLAVRGSKDCEPFEALPNAATMRRKYGLGDSCVAWVVRKEAMSRYEYSSSSGWEVLWRHKPLRPIERSWQRVRDRITGELVAESVSVRFVNWVGAQLEFPGWAYTRLPSGKAVSFEVIDVIHPT